MKNYFVTVRESKTTCALDLSKDAENFLDAEFVKITKSTDRIFVIGCGQKEYGAIRLCIRAHRGASVPIGEYYAAGVFPRTISGEGKIPCTPCMYLGRKAIYFNYR